MKSQQRTLHLVTTLSFALVSQCSLSSLAQTPAQGSTAAEGPCKQILDACTKAGFIVGDAKDGKGTWIDCVDPIMQSKAQPKTAKLPLPTVSPDLVAQCKAKHPKFGEKQK